MQSSPWLYSQQHWTPVTQLSSMASTYHISQFSSYTPVIVQWLLTFCWFIFLCQLLHAGVSPSCFYALHSFLLDIQYRYSFIPLASVTTYTLMISKFTSPHQSPHLSLTCTSSFLLKASTWISQRPLKLTCPLVFLSPHPNWSSSGSWLLE